MLPFIHSQGKYPRRPTGNHFEGGAEHSCVTDADTEIRELDEQTIAQIAAGEVIERPASVVKELIENSLDAGATDITVAVEEGGIDAITVEDNGNGMSRADVRMAVNEHTTSKLTTHEDLRTIDTLGFRGEALHTIGAVSQMTVTTRPQDGEAGTRLRYVGGETEAVEPAGTPPGTTVEVEDLFFNTPARQKHLAEPTTEFRHISRVTSRYAIANPAVAVTLIHNGSTVFSTTGQGDRQAAIMAVYGRDVAASMNELTQEPPDPLTGIDGYVSDPETTRASRAYVSIYINGRYVEPTALQRAVIDAYGGQLAADRYPFATLFIEMPPEQVDVNVHPRKLTVRLDNEEAVRDAVETVVRETLLDAGHLRESAPRGRSAPAETDVAIEDTDHHDRKATQTVSTAEEKNPAATEEQPQHHGSSFQDSSRTQPASATITATTQQSLTAAETAPTPTGERLPDMRVLGQLHGTYIVAAAETGLVLIDQHAADERIQYEQLKATFNDDTQIQQLAEPVTIDLTPEERATIDSQLDRLAELGFHAALDDRQLTVRTVPAVLSESLSADRIHDVFAALTDEERAGDHTIRTLAATELADLACRPAVTANTELTEGQISRLLTDLDACDNPYACPHGRPTVIELGTDELAERFERDYPGHGDRREL